MDVTSMLNQGAAAARREAEGSSDLTPTPSVVDSTTVCSSAVQTPSPEQTPSRRTSDSSRTPNRARTPWDAGGYSLPLTLDTKTAIQPLSKPSYYSESPIDSASPKSPKHRFSDSYSSLSSYTSSLHSVSHSRFSSLSTVSGFQSVPPLITDMPPLDSRACDTLDSAISRSSAADYFGKRLRKDGGGSPTTIAEEPFMEGARRPGSPSDAMLIRGSVSSERMSPQDFVNYRATTANLAPPSPISPDSKAGSGFLALPDLSKSHKRAISAPDFAAIGVINQSYSAIPQTLQPTPPPSHQGDRRASYMMEALSASPTAPNSGTVEESIKCMYVDNCDTGSQPRKAISHIFGRNKLCTRMIPSHVWVHFCRKHYQRSRYRNAQEYSKLQCELVQKQIQRVQAWSDSNKQAGRSGVVQDWSLSVRKREQKRIDDQTSSGKKRRFRDESEEEDADNAVLNGTAVPNWLLTKCNSGYSTAQIEEIVAQLKLEMDEGKLAQIPDIEILPNISTDSSEDGKSKVAIKRKTSAGSGIHKRSQSVGFTQGLHHDLTPMMRRVSQPGFTGDWSPIEKRQRIHTISQYGMVDRQNQRGSLTQVPERGVPMMGSVQHTVLPHRPASYNYSNIRENPIEEAYYDHAIARNPQYTYGGPLPVPTPQRLGQSIATQLETNTASQSYFEVRRPMHQRAHSEMGMFNHDPNFTFRSTSMAYTGAPQAYAQEPLPYETCQAPTYGSTGGPPGYYDDVAMNRSYTAQHMWSTPAGATPSPYAMPRHGRHQSTSAVPQAVPRMGPSEETYGSLNGSPGRFDGQHSQHRRQYSYNPSYTLASETQRIQETDQAKALFRERR
ncbi:hypothetical protein BKA67DRAFT_246835 [Truncatella angustata]|uniref:ORP1 like protein n=1 Tax=Truncatella angustata TaxID=152316 RepID=A0A9P8ZY66_9PEZI|nr:uncharacterized protein BKA67DRAFT_246835 [Truncatella angustata]KAH6655716.1 hypothetical protein BKA67DRAFT_246835 [Truncatella angustata]